VGSAARPVCELLLVEDNPADATLLRSCLADSRCDFRVSVVGDGDGALAFLRRDGAFADRTLPDMILLDLNLPGRDGREILAEIREHPEWNAIPIVVLTSSQSPSDVRMSYARGADRYLTKPIDLGGYDAIVVALEALQRARLEP